MKAAAALLAFLIREIREIKNAHPAGKRDGRLLMRGN